MLSKKVMDVLGGIPDQVGRGPGHPGLVTDLEVCGPAYGRRVEIR